jgi:hypothetical protein
VEAVARQLVGRHILPNFARLCALRQQASEQIAQVLLRTGDVLSPMEKNRELSAVVLMLDPCVGLEHRFEPLARVTTLVPEPDRGSGALR